MIYLTYLLKFETDIAVKQYKCSARVHFGGDEAATLPGLKQPSCFCSAHSVNHGNNSHKTFTKMKYTLAYSPMGPTDQWHTIACPTWHVFGTLQNAHIFQLSMEGLTKEYLLFGACA